MLFMKNGHPRPHPKVARNSGLMTSISSHPGSFVIHIYLYMCALYEYTCSIDMYNNDIGKRGKKAPCGAPLIYVYLCVHIDIEHTCTYKCIYISSKEWRPMVRHRKGAFWCAIEKAAPFGAPLFTTYMYMCALYLFVHIDMYMLCVCVCVCVLMCVCVCVCVCVCAWRASERVRARVE